MNTEQLQTLIQPFAADVIEWKPGATTKDKTSALGLAYVDLRRYFDRLDAVAPGDWSDDYDVLGDGTIVKCRLTIAGVTRCDVGQKDEADQNTTTGAAAQAFKRACAKFGLGRHLYDMPQVWAEFDGGTKRFTPGGLAKLRTAAHNVAGRPAGGATRAAAQRNGGNVTTKAPNGAQKAPESASSADAEFEKLPSASKAPAQAAALAHGTNGNGSNGHRPARPTWSSPDDAKAWAAKQVDAAGVLIFAHANHVANAYAKLRTAYAAEAEHPTPAEFFDRWYADVQRRIAEANAKLDAELDAAAAAQEHPNF